MNKRNVETVYELSPLQQGILLHTLAAPQSGTYFEQITWRVRGRFDSARFVASWERAVARHAVLRTSFHAQGLEKPLQVVHRQAALPVHEEDWRASVAAAWDAQLDAYLDADRRRGFDLAEAPLFRLGIIRLADDAWQVVVSFHHLLLDGWSVALLMREVAVTYDATGRGEPSRLEKVRPFRDYIAWLQRQDMAEAEAFWRGALRGFSAPTPVSAIAAKERSPRRDRDDIVQEDHLSAEAAESLRQFARRERVTLNTVVQGAWALLLSRYSGQADVLFGSVTAGRPTELEGVDAMIGMFINTVPMRVAVSPDDTVGPWLRELQALQQRTRQYEHAPLVSIHGWSDVPRSQPLFTSIVAFENYPADRAQGAAPGEFAVSDIRVFEKTNFPLNLVVKPSDVLGIRLLSDGRQFDRDASRRLLGHFKQILEGVTADASRKLSAVSMLTDGERQQVVDEWNQTDREYPRSACIQDLFEQQVRRDPEAVAVVYQGRPFTYADLSVRSSRLAHRLRRLGVRAGSLVGVCVDRSDHLIVSLLGILKAGGAYVPLDPTYPAKRLEFMFTDAELQVLVAQRGSLDRLGARTQSVMCVDLDDPSIQSEPTGSVESGATPDDLAYVTYTSGSTGLPKGVEVRHRGVLRLVFGAGYAPLGPETRTLQVAPVAFDASTFEVWGALLHGGCCVVYPEGVPSASELGEIIASQGVTTMFLTTALFNKVVDQRPQALAPVRHLLTGGEAISVPHVRKAYAALPDTEIIHVYGPTEVTTFATSYRIPRTPDAGQATIPIGRPIGNTRAYVVDGLTPVPVGIAGELLLGGDGLARGYLRRPDLTAERFVPDPFSGLPGGRVYRTGDLVRLLPDGAIEFLGRIDGQVKVRGFRIELGEIDAALLSYPSIRQAVTVVLQEDAQKRLVSYVVPGGDRALAWDDLRAFLRDRLPEYMVPSRFVPLDALPINANGKVDRAALPAVTTDRQVEVQYVEPRGAVERKLAALWCEVLRVETVGVRDNFFDLGGHSLLLVQLHGKIVELGHAIPLVELFEYPTIEALAARIAPEERTTIEAQTRPRRRLRAAGEGEAVAVIGMAGRFPGAADVATFWSNLRDGVESIRSFSEEELRRAGVDERLLKDPRYVRARGVLDGADQFDASFFGYNPREADLIDPQQRVFLECAAEALDHAGYDPERYPGLIGVYAGANLNTYLLHVLAHPSVAGSLSGLQALIASGTDFLPTRVSYKLSLRGPSVNVQTACSTSLVAVHEACRSLLDNECDIALAGGVSVGVPLVRGYLHQEGGITSPDGHCRAFDADARGTVGGNGAGIVVLKRLSEAIRDGDTIHAVILGTAINNDGSGKVGYTAPGLQGQSEVIALAQDSAGIDPSTISYIEAHGTGTSLGDPVEVSALRRVFDGHAAPGSCALGTVKTNVGHLDAAAGVAGLIKTVMALQHRELPPSLHFVRPNPQIPLEGSPFYVNARLTPWESEGKPRRAGVSSFGIGGTNAHVIVEEAPAAPAAAAARAWQLLVVSARTRSALDAASARLAAHLEGTDDAGLADVAYTLQVGRRQFPHRRAVVCASAADAVAALRQADPPTGVAEAGERSVVFMCSGQGAQYAGMAAELYREDAAFRAEVDACCEELLTLGEPDLRPLLFPAAGQEAAAAEALRQTAVTQPALFVIEYALARRWEQWGVRPAALIGHSVGEYVAACLAGVFTRADALRLVARRGRLMQGLPAGAMLALPLAEAEVTPLLDGEVALAAVNGPRLCVVAGPEAAIAALETTLAARGVTGQRLTTSHAFHSAMMDPILASFEAEVAQVPRRAPRVPFLSNVTGTWITAEEATSAAYWRQHLRAPVRFAAGLQTLLADRGRILLEVGPGRTLATLARQNGAAAAGATVLTSLRHPQETTADAAGMLRALGGLWLAGVPVDWPAVWTGEARRRVPLPTYPFERQRHWIDVQPVVPAAREPAARADLSDWFYMPAWKREDPRALATSAVHSTPRWLVFADGAGVAAAAVAHLRSTGHEVIVIEAGARYEWDPKGLGTIDPGQREHYRTLFNTLRAEQRLPEVIGHFWGVTSALLKEESDSTAALERGFYSLLFLAQAIGEAWAGTAPRIGVVANHLFEITGGEPLTPSKAAVLGPVRVIPSEYAGTACRLIEIVAEEWSGAGADRSAELAAEIAAAGDPVVAYRGGERLVPWAAPLQLDAVESGPLSRLRERGVYLVTGGFGGIGQTLAQYLAAAVQARLVLIGRTALPPREQWAELLSSRPESDSQCRRIRTVEALERAGAEVMVASGDVSDMRRVAEIVADAERRFGPLNGIIHAAGIAPGGVMQAKAAAAAEAVLAPKVAGTQALATATAGTPLDFFVLCSSLASVLDGAGQVDYRAANAYQDAFAWSYRQRTGRFAVSINWDTWREVGMAVDTHMPADLDRRRMERLDRGMTPEEGVEVFKRVLRDGRAPQILISTLPLRPAPAPVQAASTDAAIPASFARHARPEIQTAFAAPLSEIEGAVAEVWQELLGIDRVGREDNFFDLGGHSLLLVQAHAKLGEKLGRSLAVTDLFQFPTIASLAQHLGGERVDLLAQAPAVAASADDEAIAIVGMACRLPGAADVDSFWANIRDGVESIRPIADGELSASGLDDALLRDPRYIRVSSAVEGADLFDAAFFGYSPREAELLDPQHRVFLECAWEAFERAGCDPATYPGQIGVFAGASSNGYLTGILANAEVVSSVGVVQAAMGSRSDFLPMRVSYKLNLRGPSVNVQTACSTSLVAVHQACRSLLDRDSDVALAGGVSIGVPLHAGYFYVEDGILSPDGHCRAFDARGQGTVPASGAAVVVLKRLSDARRDGDTIHAVILGSAVNNDGAQKVGFTAPGIEGQAQVIARAQAAARVAPSDIDYVEAHGTATALGDPIEIAALARAFGTGEPATCAIGTLKSNLGHLDAAAGVAGLIKTVLALEQRLLPPSLHFETANPKIAFDTTPFYVNTALAPWKAKSAAKRRAGVSSFGIGGTNAHVIVEEAPALPSPSPSRAWQLLVLSAKTRTALDAATARLADHLDGLPEEALPDAAHTLRIGRRHFPHRRVVVSTTAAEAAAALRQPDRDPVATASTGADRSVVFMLSGQGSQYAGMGASLYRDEPVFRDAIDTCCGQLIAMGEADLRPLMFAADSADALRRTAVTQPALFVVEYALARLWESWGVRAAAFIGHSIGEYVAACLAGVFSVADALRLVALRGRLMQGLPDGAMLAVPMSEADVTALLPDDLSLAAVNGPRLCVVAGPDAAVAAFASVLVARGVAGQRLATSHAFHSAMMDPVLDTFEAEVARVPKQAPARPFISNVTGTWITAEQATSAAYWRQHLRAPVRFAAGVQTLLGEPRILLEVGPGRTLATLARQSGAGAAGAVVLTSLRHAQETTPDQAAVLKALGALWLAGVPVDWTAFDAAEQRRRVPLPTYPFERQRYWIEAPRSAAIAPAQRPLVKNADLASWFYEPRWVPAAAAPRVATDGTWLIFADDTGIGAGLRARLLADGQPVVLVRPGTRLARVDDRSFTLNPAEASEYDTLLAEAAPSGRISRIVHLWSVGAAGRGETDAFAAAQSTGFYSVLALSQALGRRQDQQPVDLIVVGDAMQRVADDDRVAAEKAPVLGLCLVIPQENPAIRCGTIDLPHGARDLREVVDALYEEASVSPDGIAVAYRGRQRFVQSFAPVPLPETAAETWVRDGGTYLITGGLGAVSLAIAERMARTRRVRLVLVNRTGLPAEAERQAWLDGHPAEDRISTRILRVRRLETLGAEVLVVAGDVSSLVDMQAAVDAARARFGAINGVIHAAGAMDGVGLQAIAALDRAGCEAQFAPKVRGVAVLEEVLGGQPLDFCVATSSLSAVLGGLTFGAYAAANRFLDGLADSTRPLPWKSVDLDGWRFIESEAKNALIELAMTPAEGVEAVARVIGAPSSRVVVSTADLSTRVDRYVRRAPVAAPVAGSAPPALARYARPELDTQYAAPLDDIQERIADVWQELLGIEKIGRNDNFFDLGGHSLLLVQAQGKISAKLGRDLSVAQLFQYPTIAALAEHIGGVPRQAPQVSARVEPFSADRNAVAVVGMALRVPGAADVDAFWANLRDGVESVEQLTDHDMISRGVDPAVLKLPNYVKAASAIDGIELFDAPFFGYSPREAELIDPQHRLFLECAWEALERAGCDPDRYPGLIGVFAGAGFNRYMDQVLSNPEVLRSVGMLQAGMGSKSDYLPTRVSYKLNLRGPSVNVQTACSTSLVAIHQACRSLVDGECDAALAGGAAIGVPGKTGYLYVEDNILSPDGRCRAFDARAQGTIMASGVGVVLLKRLSDALADGDVIHAVVRGSAINNDGSGKVGYTAPSVDGQAAVIARAQKVAGVEPAAISYVEAHGTATSLGDPIEIAALAQAFGPAAPATVAIGTLKSNLGHLDAAAGVAGFIKTALSLEHRELPPSLHYETPNPRIDFASTPFFVNTALTPWRSSTPRLAGVSSFGIGGTNAHAILEEPPVLEPSGPSREAQLLLVSARTRTALKAAAARLADHLQGHTAANLADVAYTLQVGRHEFAHRLAVDCTSIEEAIAALPKAAGGDRSTGEAPSHPVPVAFMFPGQGAQYVDMGRDLYRDEAVFRATVDDCCAALEPHLGFDLRRVLYPSDADRASAADRLTQTACAQPALFVIEYALATLWQSWGIAPRALIGHSVGEYVAACLAGVFDLQDALALVAARGRLMQSVTPGVMLAVAASQDRIRPLLSDRVWLSAINGPTLSVISCAVDHADAVEELLKQEGLAARRLDTSHAFHSPMMDPIVDEFTALVSRTPRRAPRVPFVSNVTGTWIDAQDAQDPAYWGRHLRQPVRFLEGMGALLDDSRRLLLEVGPGRTLSGLAKQHPSCDRKRAVVASFPQQPSAPVGRSMAAALGRLWVSGIAVDWQEFYRAERRRRVILPTYPFERKRYWIDQRAIVPATPARAVERAELADWFRVPSWKRSPIPAADPATALAPQRWLVFADETGVAAAAVALLRQRGHDVVIVDAGRAFAAAGPGRYVIDPSCREHYGRLIAALKSAKWAPDAVGHFWGVSASDGIDAPSDRQLERGFYSLLFLAQSLGESQFANAMRVGVVTTGVLAAAASDPVSPAKAAVLGPVRVIPREYPSIACRAIDIVASDWTTADDRRTSALLAEMAAAGDDVVVAHRGHERWVPALESARLEALDAGLPSRLRERGVYLITGGGGGIGLTLAGYLARSVKARLVLTGRTALPIRGEWAAYVQEHGDADRISRQIRAVEALEQSGAEVLVVAADVSDPVQAQAAVDAARERFGRIDGVIHAAGVAGGGIIQLKEREAAAKVLAPKVIGTHNLWRALGASPLDFLVLCSSMTSLVGGGGQVDYCAANACLDAFAHACTRQTGTFTVAINWDAWREVGMAVDTTAAGDDKRHALLERAIGCDEGIEAFARILARGASPQVAVSTLRSTEFDDAVRGRAAVEAAAVSPAGPLARYERPELQTGYEAPVSEIEQAIAEVWQNVLGIDRIGREDNFFELGGHSLLLVQAHASLAARLERPVAITDLFQFPTIAALAQHLGGGRREAVLAAPRVDRDAAAGEAVAIIGMACRFPGAPDLETFWANLRDGIESIMPVSDEELRQHGVPEPLLNHPRYVKAAGAIEGADLFDAAFFGYSPREAELIDPQHRLFLECSWEALERAGYDPKRYPGAGGVYAGIGTSGYAINVFSNADVIQTSGTLQAAIGNKSDYLPTRVSYKLNLRGPSVNVQTACSTSLVAVHQACRSLLDRECDMALAGGASVTVPLKAGYFHLEESILSPDGHCRTFDAKARGTVMTNGVGVVALKRLADAVADGDVIHAVIRGTALNNDGAMKVGYTAPGVEGQAAVIARAQAAAGVDPADITYVEAHGTATTLGDPIEVAALSQAFTGAPRGGCALGSVKSNIGHLDAAAGVAALIKTTLALEHRVLPASLHFETPNPQIDFASTPFYVNTRAKAWETGGRPRLAGVSSFGIGGTNAHAVLEEAPAALAPSPSREWQLLVASARSEAALDAATARLSDWLQVHPDASLPDVAFTLQTGRHPFEWRRAVVCRAVDGAIRALEGAPATQAPARAARAVFLFPGQGAQYAGMGRDLYQHEPRFRAVIDECAERLTAALGLDIRDLMFGTHPDADASLRRTSIAQPALFVFELALARLWEAAGVTPSACVGHSIGEYVAAHLAGVWSLDDALALVAERGRLMERTAPGTMLAVALPAETLLPMLDGLALAAANGPALSVASGSVEAIARLEAQLADQQIETRRLHTSHAFHSDLMDPVLAEFRDAVARTERHAPTIPFASNVTGRWIEPDEARDPDYWVRHLRGTVRFAESLATAAEDPTSVLLEMGPGRTLATLARDNAAVGRRAVITIIRHPQETRSDQEHLLNAFGRAWAAGVDIDWKAFHADEQRRRVELPTYPFERKRFWIERAEAAPAARVAALTKDPDVGRWLYAPGWRTSVLPRLTAAPDATPRTWVLFADSCGVASCLRAVLERRGDRVAVVMPGNRFSAVGLREFTVDPAARADFDRLFHQLRSDGLTPETIVHLWGVAPDAREAAGGTVLEPDDLSFYSVASLAQAIAGRTDTAGVQFTVVTTGSERAVGYERIVPSRAAVHGLVRVIPQEYPDIHCRVVDLDAGAGDAWCSTMAGALISELSTAVPDVEVAYRHGVRWTRVYDRVPMPPPQSVPLTDRGVYLITGGMGNVGLALAGYLARAAKARLVLTQRTPLPAPDLWDAWLAEHDDQNATAVKIRQVRALEAAGAEVLVLAADAADERRLADAIGEAERYFGALNGVIHAAGIISDRTYAPVIDLDRGRFAEQFQSKIKGLTALDRLIGNRTLDFRIAVSSLSTILGGIGYGAYASANAFMDAFVTGADAAWQSINFDAWRFAGDEAHVTAAQLALTPSEGADAFARILAAPHLRQVVVSTADLDARLQQWVTRTEPSGSAAQSAEAGPRYERPALAQAYDAPTNEIEEQVAAVWGELFGIDRVGIHDNFFELGGHSLLATQLVSRLRQAFGVSVGVAAIFAAQTVAELSAHLMEKMLEQDEADGAEPLLSELQQLSEEDVVRELRQKSGV